MPMLFVLCTVPVILLHICVEISCILRGFGENGLEERHGTHPRYVPPEILAHCAHSAKAMKTRQTNGKRNVDLGDPAEQPSCKILNPTYAKALYTSYPGRVVCQLGRYTFVINYGQHKMGPEIIERFAAMVYHRAQEGDSLRSPVFIKCSPLEDDRQVSSEVVYSCRRRELGLRGIEKSMIITVDKEGTVSAGDLVLPFSALLDYRLKRRKCGKPDMNVLGSPRPKVSLDNKVFSDQCPMTQKGWCPRNTQTSYPDALVSLVIAPKAAATFSQQCQWPNGVAVPVENEAAIYAQSTKAMLMVRMYTDICTKQSIYPWCPSRKRITECTTKGCITLPNCPVQRACHKVKRRRREQQEGKKAVYFDARYRLNNRRTSRSLGQKRIFMRKRKHQAKNTSQYLSQIYEQYADISNSTCC